MPLNKKTKCMKKNFLVICTAICFSTATVAQTNATLNLSKGQKYQVENKLVTTSSTDIQGQSMESKADVTSTYTIEVKDKKADNYHLTNTLSHLLMNTSMMGQELTFDSDKKEDMDGEMGSSLKGYVNQAKEVVIDKAGKVVSMSTDSVESAMVNQLHLASNGYGSQMAFLALPKNAKVGTSWSENTDDSAVKRTTNYTIKSIDGNTATVGFTGTIESTVKMEKQGMEISTKSSSKLSGEEKVNVKTGVVQTNNSTADATGTVNAMGQEFPITVKVISTTTVKAL